MYLQTNPYAKPNKGIEIKINEYLQSFTKKENIP
jgi:hypothetical protein